MVGKGAQGETEGERESSDIKLCVIILIHSSPKRSKKLKCVRRLNTSWNTQYAAVWFGMKGKKITLPSWFRFWDLRLFRENTQWLVIWHLSSQTSYQISRSENKYQSRSKPPQAAHLQYACFLLHMTLFRFLTRPLELFLLWNCCQDESIPYFLRVICLNHEK